MAEPTTAAAPTPSPAPAPSAEGGQNLSASFDSIMQSGGGVSEILGKILESLSALNTGISQFITSSGSMVGSAEKIKTALSSHPAIISGIAGALSGANNSYTQFFAKTEQGFVNQSVTMQAASRLMSSVKSADFIQELQNADSALANFAGVAAENLATGATAGESILQRLKAGAEETGGLGDYMQAVGPDELGSLDMLSQRLSQIYRIASTTQLPTPSAEVFMKLTKYRGAIDSIISASDAGTISNRDLASSIIEVSSGAGVTIDQLLSVMDTLQKSSNVQSFAMEGAGAKAMGLAATTRQAANLTQNSFADMQRASDTVTSSLRLQGDNAQSLLGPLTGLILRYEKTGLSTRSATQEAQAFIQTVGNMSSAQKALVSQQTGGPGGYAGAIEIEGLMREGKGGEVFGRMQDAVQQQLGQVITFEDAQMGGEAAANARMAQIEILRASALGQGKTDEQLSRMLDTFAQRQIGDRDEMFDPSAAFQQATLAGQAAISRVTGPQTLAELGEMGMAATAIPGAYGAAQFLMGNTATVLPIKRDLARGLDIGPTSPGGTTPKAYQEGISSETMRANVDTTAALGSVTFDAVKIGVSEAGKALSDFASFISETFGDSTESKTIPPSILPAPPTPASMPVSQLAAQGTTTQPASTADATAAMTTSSATSTQESIPFLCGGCHKTFLAHISEFSERLAKRVKTKATSSGMVG